MDARRTRRQRRRPLLCEFHAHTTWSDGLLGVRDLVDLYGGAGFDVLAVTDHVLPPQIDDRRSVHAENFGAYAGELAEEAERALWEYDLLLLPGVELTDAREDPERAAHVLVLGLTEFIGLEDGLDLALDRARAAGAVLVGAHPDSPDTARLSPRRTAKFSADPEWAREAVHRLELINRHDFFRWVARELLPALATGDFHRPHHLWTWKTVVCCEPESEAVLERLRSPQPVELTRFDAAITRERAA
jgi:3',5'-nucleoside bisphosphate phosphatase